MATSRLNVLSIAGSTPISASTWSQLVASTPVPTTRIIIANGTDANVTLSRGASGSEVSWICVAAGQNQEIPLSIGDIPVGTRLSVIAESAASTKGVYTVSLIP